MPTVALTTFKDLIDRGVSYIGDNATRDAIRDVKCAILDAYRDLPNLHEWIYYYQRGRLNTVAPYSTGTITYDHTGGAFERLVTLSGGTWPAWAALGQLVVGNITYQIAERKSSAQITLTYASNPGDDVASGTSYTLYRDSYPMPVDFIASEQFNYASQGLSLRYEHPRAWLAYQHIWSGPGAPYIYTLTSDENYFGAMAARFFPVPDAAYAIDFMYKRRPRPLLVDEVKDGTLSVSAGSASLAGSGTSWLSKHIGSVIRLSANNTDYPTGPSGANSAAIERVIVDVTNGTTLVVDSPIATSYTSVKYLISDPVDVEEGAMMTVLYRLMEKHSVLTRIMKNADFAQVAFKDALIHAREADRRSLAPRGYNSSSGYPRLRDYPSGPPQG